MSITGDTKKGLLKLVTLISVVLVGLYTLSSPPAIIVDFTETPFLSHIVTGISILLAWHFKQSRVLIALVILFSAQVLLLISPGLVFTNFYRQSLTDGMIFSLIVILFSKDSTVQAKHILEGAFLICGMTFISIVFQVLIDDSNISTDTTFVVRTSLMTSIVLLSCVWLFLKPNNNNLTIALFIAVNALLSIYGVGANSFLTLLLSVFAGFNLIIDTHAMAYYDELTGIKGRRALMTDAGALRRNFTVAMADVDFFKRFNDTYGHDVGDQVLKMVAAEMSKVRGGGKAYRYGGEEFTILFPTKTPSEAKQYLDEVRESICNYHFKIRDRKERKKGSEDVRGQVQTQPNTVNVTISFGATNPNRAKEDFNKVMKRADQLLYKAKENGRNQVVINENVVGEKV